MYIHNRSGQKISRSTFYSLPYHERKNYREESSLTDDVIDLGINAAIGYGIASIFDSDTNSSNDISSSFDSGDSFGSGGDFGGGGADGDW